jgi:hypothetical protein
LNPALTGREQGCGLYIIHSQDVRDPPLPLPVRAGFKRGRAAHCFWVVFCGKGFFGVESYIIGVESYKIINDYDYPQSGD